MPKYLLTARFTADGMQGLLKEGPLSRRASAEKLFQGVGGKLESLYYGFGNTDLYVIVDLPDNVTAAAVTMFTNAAGAAAQDTVVLLTPEEVEQSTKVNVNYRFPGT